MSSEHAGRKQALDEAEIHREVWLRRSGRSPQEVLSYDTVIGLFKCELRRLDALVESIETKQSRKTK